MNLGLKTENLDSSELEILVYMIEIQPTPESLRLEGLREPNLNPKCKERLVMASIEELEVF